MSMSKFSSDEDVPCSQVQRMAIKHKKRTDRGGDVLRSCDMGSSPNIQLFSSPAVLDSTEIAIEDFEKSLPPDIDSLSRQDGVTLRGNVR